MHTFADHSFARGMRAATRRKPWWLLGVVAVVALVAGGLGGWAVGSGTKASVTPGAEPVARQLGTLLATAHGNLAYADRATALFSKDAVGIDMPSGEQAGGSWAIRQAWQYVIGWRGAWRIGPVLANDRWAVVVATRTRTQMGKKVSRPWVLLLKVRNGKIVSESDIYDAKSWRW